MKACLLLALFLLPSLASASEHCRKGGSSAACRKEIVAALDQLHDQLPSSFDFMHEACLDAEEDFACAIQANWVRRGADPKYADPKTFFGADRLDRLKSECARNDAIACAGAGLAVEKGLAVPRSVDEGYALQDKACDLGYLWACRGSKAACAKGAPISCAAYGFDLIDEGPLPENFPEAFRVFKQACEGGSALGCNSYAWMHEFGYGVEKNIREAEILYFKACRMTNGQACRNLGSRIMDYHPEMPLKDRQAKAFDLFSRSCNFGWGGGCLQLARMYVSGDGLPRSLETGISLLRRGCDLDDAQACRVLGEYARRGKGMDPSEELAKLFEDKSASKEMIKVIEGND